MARATDGFSEVSGERIGAALGLVGQRAGATRPTSAGGAGSSRPSSWPGSPSRRVPGGWTSARGTGALTEAVLACCAPAEVVGVEPSDAFRAYAAEQVPDPRASFRAGDARALPVDDGGVRRRGLRAGAQLRPRPAGRAGRDAPRGPARRDGRRLRLGLRRRDAADDALLGRRRGARTRRPRPCTRRARFAFCRPDPLRGAVRRRGAAATSRSRAIVVPTDFARLRRLLDAVPRAAPAPAPAYAPSLDEADRAALRDAVRGRLPIADDGSIHLTARAWAVRGYGPRGFSRPRIPVIPPHGIDGRLRPGQGPARRRRLDAVPARPAPAGPAPAAAPAARGSRCWSPASLIPQSGRWRRGS